MERCGLGTALLVAMCACDPSDFDRRHEHGEPYDGGFDASIVGGDVDGRTPTSTFDASADVVDAATTVDAGLLDGGPSPCVAARDPRALAVVADSVRVIARVPNPRGVSARHAISIRPLGPQLLWTLITTSSASTLDGGVGTVTAYPSVARSPLKGAWSNPESDVAILELDEHRDDDGLPVPLLSSAQEPPSGLPIIPVGVVVRDAIATLYLKQYGYVASYAMFTATLTPGQSTLTGDLSPLFRIDQMQHTFGTAAFERQGEVYALSCEWDGNDNTHYPCYLGRAADERLTEASAYEGYRADMMSWSPKLSASTELFSAGEVISLSFNKYLGQWLVVSSDFGAGTQRGFVYLRTAPKPEGPWSVAVAVALPPTPNQVPPAYVLEQPDLAQNCGQRLVFSYQEPTSEPYFGNSETGSLALMALDLQ